MGFLEGINAVVDACFTFVLEAFLGIVGIVGDSLKDPNGILNFAYTDFREHYGGIFMTVGMFILILSFGINVINNGIAYELFTAKGAVRVIGQFFLGIAMIAASSAICDLIINIAGDLSTAILSQANTDLVGLMAETPEVAESNLFSSSSIPLIGPVITGIINAVLGLLVMIVEIVMLLLMMGICGIVMFFVYVKLGMRTIQLAILTTMAPPFFACAANDATKEYFRKFLSGFLSTVAELVFMALIFAIIPAYMNNGNNVFTDPLVCGVVLACCMMMLRPPAVLRNLIS